MGYVLVMLRDTGYGIIFLEGWANIEKQQALYPLAMNTRYLEKAST